jgi:hypothetical protein
MEGTGSYSLPEDLALAEVARALRGTGQWGWVVDSRWLLVYVTNDSRLTTGGGVELAPYPIGSHLFGPEAVRTGPQWRFGANTPEFVRGMFAGLGSLVLADTPGGRDRLRELVDPSLCDPAAMLFADLVRDRRPCARLKGPRRAPGPR